MLVYNLMNLMINGMALLFVDHFIMPRPSSTENPRGYRRTPDALYMIRRNFNYTEPSNGTVSEIFSMLFAGGLLYKTHKAIAPNKFPVEHKKVYYIVRRTRTTADLQNFIGESQFMWTIPPEMKEDHKPTKKTGKTTVHPMCGKVPPFTCGPRRRRTTKRSKIFFRPPSLKPGQNPLFVVGHWDTYRK